MSTTPATLKPGTRFSKSGRFVNGFTRHTTCIRKNSDEIARLLVMHHPAGKMEEYFRTVIQQADQTIEGRRALAEKHGMKILGSALKAE